MSTSLFSKAAASLEAAAARYPHALVAYSGGKDSRAVLDMAVKAFPRVTAFLCWFLPGLAVEEAHIAYAKSRWGVHVLTYPYPLGIKYIKQGVYCDQGAGADRLPAWSFDDVRACAIKDAGTPLVLTGAKYTDAAGQGLTHRKDQAKRDKEGDTYIRPIAEWNKWHVLSYLRANAIEVPENDGRNSASIDLTPDCILWLHDKHPEDFKLLCKVFRYAEAVVKRRDWHGVS